MNVKKNLSKSLDLTVMEGLTVNVVPNEAHEFLMTTKEVALGYGTSIYAINMNRLRHNTELIEGRHYFFAITKCYSDLGLPHNAILWTKRGIVRLGFFIKSERARLFRDWAEELILSVSENLTVNKALPGKRKHNRLTADRLIAIMGDVCQIDDKALRISITNKLLGKEVQDGNL